MFAESQRLVIYVWKYINIYNVCSIKLGIKVLLLHKIRVQSISLFCVIFYVVHDF